MPEEKRSAWIIHNSHPRVAAQTRLIHTSSESNICRRAHHEICERGARCSSTWLWRHTCFYSSIFVLLDSSKFAWPSRKKSGRHFKRALRPRNILDTNGNINISAWQRYFTVQRTDCAFRPPTRFTLFAPLFFLYRRTPFSTWTYSHTRAASRDDFLENFYLILRRRVWFCLVVWGLGQRAWILCEWGKRQKIRSAAASRNQTTKKCAFCLGVLGGKSGSAPGLSWENLGFTTRLESARLLFCVRCASKISLADLLSLKLSLGANSRNHVKWVGIAFIVYLVPEALRWRGD